MQTLSKLLIEAERCEQNAKEASFEGLHGAADLFQRQAAFLREANNIIPCIKHDEFWTRCLMGYIPTWPNSIK